MRSLSTCKLQKKLKNHGEDVAKLSHATNSNKIAWILDHIENQDVFLRDLFRAISVSVKKNDTCPLIVCIEEWYATAEINAIPGMKKRIWKAYAKIPQKRAPRGHRKFQK